MQPWDKANRLTSVGADTDGNGSTDQSLSLYDYDALSQLTGIRRGTGSWSSPVTATDIAWEADGDLDALTHAFNGEVAGFDYGYDRSAKLVMETTTAAFAHSPVAAQAIAYSLGAAGSATSKLDQYASIAGKTAAYDLNGNRISLDGLDTEHDSENRLVAASKGAMSVAYLYDAAGRRVMKGFASGGTDMAFVSAGDMEIAEYEGGTLLRRYVPGLKVDDRVAMIEASGAISYYHPDRLGNVLAMTNGSGVITDRYKMTPFGIEEPLALSGNPYRYTGRRFDPETGLYHYRARYYDPSETGGGRFLETDPVGYADYMNLYAYVANDPLNATDPSGKNGRRVPRGSNSGQPLEPLRPRYEKRGRELENWLRNANPSWRDSYGEIVPQGGASGWYTRPHIDSLQRAANSEYERALADPNANSSPVPPPGYGRVAPYEVGPHDILKGRSVSGDGLALHHVGQGNPMGQIVPGYNYSTGPAIVLPEGEHWQIPNLKGPYEGSARELLARDILNLRRHTNAPNLALQELIEINRTYGGFNK